MHAENAAGKKIGDASGASPFISDAHRTFSRTDVSRLREIFNDAVAIPANDRRAWLMRNVADPDEREAIATLLLAYDGDGLFDVDGDH